MSSFILNLIAMGQYPALLGLKLGTIRVTSLKLTHFRWIMAEQTRGN